MFEDLEGQLASEWEAERAALDAESERLRVSKLDLRTRLRALCAADAVVQIDLPARPAIRARLQELGADWVSATAEDRGLSIIPIDAIRGMRMDHGLMLASLAPSTADVSVRERMTFGFVLRDLARRRIPVRIEAQESRTLYGTIDRAGADQLDLAEHDAGAPRRADQVRAMHLIPFSAVVRVRLDAPQG